jgi:GTP pyrophosphokinase
MHKQSKLVYTDAGMINIEAWLQNIGADYPQNDITYLRRACILAQVAGEGHTTPNGESCLHQGLAMAEILAGLNLDLETLTAAIVYSSAQYADLSLEDISDHLGANVAKLIKGTRQMDAIHSLHGQLTQRTHLATTIDNLRKMLLAMVEDVRVVLIKLAERLCILHNMLVFTPVEKQRIAGETRDVYAPLANRLGIGHLKWQLEDLSFRYLQSDEYHSLSRALKDRRVDREQYVEQLTAELKTAMHHVGIYDAEVTGRAKHIYSIYRKMRRKNVPLSEIYDAIAFRILVPTIDDCYSALGIVHSLWNHIPKEFDDYIIQPKPNGYRSIHTAVIGPQNKFVEIQIRTFDMHREAELGVAAHWIYKEGKVATGYKEKIAWLRQVMDWQKELTESEKENRELYSHAFEDRIYVFTPNGDVIDLAKGATPLDFAYYIHSELGNHCRGAKVNDVIVPLTYQLNSGERVAILVAKQGHPSRDWLNPHLGYLKTSRAKAKVLNWFRKQDHDSHLMEGHDLLDKELRRLGIREIPHEELAHRLNYKNKDDMFVAIGRGDLRMGSVLQVVQLITEGITTPPVEKIPVILPEGARFKSEAPTDIVIAGVGNLLTHLAGCCKPVPGDIIVGYVTIGRGVSIHRQDCVNVLHNLRNKERLLEVSWGNQTHRRYPVGLNIIAYDRQGLIRDISSLLANEHISIVGLNSTSDKKDNTAYIQLTIEVDSLNPLNRIIMRIQQLPNIVQVHRG